MPPEFDAVIESDRRFFARRRDRSYRVRHAAPVELQVSREAGQTFAPLVAGARWFTAVRQVARGYRVRAFYQSFDDAEVNLSEAVSRRLYAEACGSEGHQLAEAMERAIYEKRGA
ncbi:hypothetical protein FPV16_25550 [Methylobacterium sp. W2]|uniref:hypothetical protein n=1 Tax=Methylobacterium sp. W2 TaxID=2598107 RepID=UPI001D0CDA29|nr:hypothetical protein [Methylobacterium sp. W2]MCC0809524.1 hypothetical protein [Methylobacterium sp. W2]